MAGERSIGFGQIVEDWSTVKKRWEAWWEGSLYDGAMVTVTAPRDGVIPDDLPDVDPETQWTDVEYMIRRALRAADSTYYGGGAVPCLWNNWSAGHALYLGCEPHFSSDTVWVDPAPVTESGYPEFDDWRNSAWYRWMLDSTEAAAKASQGRYFVMPAWGNHAGDNLGLVRGTPQLMRDIAFDPQWARSALKEASEIQIEVFEALWDRVAPEKVGVEGFVNYVGGWSSTRTMGFDCDISCMVSAETFRETFLPPLVETMHTVEHRLYHLDGPGALHHLDTLLDVPELHAIQWVPGWGREAMSEWIPLLSRIQLSGKNIVVSVRQHDVDLLLDELRPEGLCIQTHCPTEDDARALLDRVAAR